MKSPIIKILWHAALAVAVAANLQCSKTPTPLAGGASSTEVSACAIMGIVLDSLGNPISGGIVRLRPFNYIPFDDGGDSEGRIIDATTNKDGRYRFDSVIAGRYLIECVFADSLGQTIDCSIDSGETLKVMNSAIVKPMAIIEGSNMPTHPSGSRQPEIQAVGMEHSAPIDSMGDFRMKVPSGWTRLTLQGIDSNNATLDTLVYLNPGEKVKLIPPPPKPPKHCDSLSCDMAIVREILDGSGLSAIVPESVAVISQNRVNELRLRSKGMKLLSQSIGKLGELRVLDVGNNALDSLPSTLEYLHNLEVLIADSNVLWKIPASIGMIETLQKLDLSSNLLQSLPEPITYLRPAMLLDLNNNMLCNIGETTIRWADKYDPGWKVNQLCQ